MDPHETVTLIREKYAAMPEERSYVKTSEQTNFVIVKGKKTSNILLKKLAKVFLPHGWPHTVSTDYTAYQQWDTAQAFCSTIMGIMATQAVLTAVGVGDKTATPLAATITWVLKDGCGHLGRILFAYSHGSCLDSYSKKWRLFADTLNDAAMCIEIALPLFHNCTTFALCISTIMKSIVGVAGGATRVAMTQHHAIRGNIGDVAAKDSAQETAVNLVASITALLIITYLGNPLIIFIVMMILHLYSNYLAVRAVCLRTLNEPRFLQVIDRFLQSEDIATPSEINRSEPIIFYQFGSNSLDLKMCGFEIKLGQSLAHITQYSQKASVLNKIKEIYSKHQYIVFPIIDKRKMYVFLKEHASVEDILQAYFHAVLLAIITSEINKDSVVATETDPKPFAELCKKLRELELALPKESSIQKPPFELLDHVCQIVDVEWPVMKIGLLQTGWSLNKHVLMMDEWRVTGDSESEAIHPDNATTEKNDLPENYSTPKIQRRCLEEQDYGGTDQIVYGYLRISKAIPVENTESPEIIRSRKSRKISAAGLSSIPIKDWSFDSST